MNRDHRRFIERRLAAQKRGLGPVKIVGQEPEEKEKVQNGDLVYFKTIQKNSRPDSMKAVFKGMGFGMLLGEVPPFVKDPTPDQLLAIMGGYGFCLFDDIAEFLGEDVAKQVVEKHAAKYAASLQAPVEKAPIEEPSKLVGIDGTPMKESPP